MSQPGDLDTFEDVITAFEKAEIDVRDSYWSGDPRTFRIVVDDGTFVVTGVELVDGDIVVKARWVAP